MADTTRPEAPGGQQAPTRDRKRDVRMVIIGVVVVLLVWFAIGNLHREPVHFWVFSGDYPVIVVIVISGLLGAALTLLATRMTRRRKQPADQPSGQPPE